MEGKKDDEITIDFSKIKNIFKRKRDEPSHAVQKPESSEQVQEKKGKEGNEESGAIQPETKLQEKGDEITIDFTKIRNIFKKKVASEPEEGKTIGAQKSDEEISIDFSKIKNIKNIFKSDKKEDPDNIALDFKKIANFLIEHRVLLLIAIPIFLAIFLRVQPAFLPITDDWARDSVLNNVRSQIRSQIDQQYPNLPAPNIDNLVQTEMEKVLREQGTQINAQILATSNALKERLQDDTGQTYLLAIDPYFWMRHAKNVIENGHPGDEIRNGQPWDTHMFAPNGRGVPADMFHAYFEAFLFKILSIFNSDLNLMKVVFFVPVMISAISVIPAFFITRRIAGNFGGFIAATIIAIHPSFLSRTAGGFADTDAYNVMFPLVIAWLFLEALDSKTLKKNIILSASAGILVGLYSFTWGGWWYIFDFILASTVFYISYYVFVHKNDLLTNIASLAKSKAIKNSIAFLVVFFVLAAISTTIFVSYGHFTNFAKNPTGFARLKEVGITTIWPNVFTTVAEQNPASLNNVVNQVGLGRPLFFLIALMGITLTLTRRENKKLWFIFGALAWFIAIFFLNIQNLNTFLILVSIPIVIRILIALWESDRDIDIKYAIFLTMWFIATTFASTKGIRFTLLLVPAFAIGFGVTFGEIYRNANHLLSKYLNVSKVVSKTTLVVVLLIFLIAPYQSAASTAKNEVPSFNDAWRISLEKIKADSQPDAIINSWWDFGHWFKFWADRPVTFDGTSQNTPQAHWIGKVLLTDNEELAIGILRMLDCSGTSGGTLSFNKIAEITGDQAKSIKIMYDIMPKSKEEARKILLEKFNEQDTEEVLELTHCEPPENYFITSEDMVGKSGVWAHFGSWDFDRALIYNTLKKKGFANDIDKSKQFLKERFNFSDEHAENLYFEVQGITNSDQANTWIAPWPGYAGVTGCSSDNNIVQCVFGFQNNVQVPFILNKSTYDVSIPATQGILHPKIVSIPTDDGLIIKEYNDSLFTIGSGRSAGVAFIRNGDSYQAVLSDAALTASMFTRMFYQESVGLNHFNQFSDERTVFGGRIIVWKVDWEGKVQKPEETEINLEENQESVEPAETNQTENAAENNT